MKSIQFLRQAIVLALIQFSILAIHAQTTLPALKLKRADGQYIDASKISGNGRPLLLVFWSLSDKKSCENLEKLNQIMLDSTLIDKVRFVAVCNNEPGQNEMVMPFVSAKEIQAEVFFDENNELKRSLGVRAPHIFLFDQEMKLHCQQKGYCSGSEDLICKAMRDCLSAVSATREN